MKFESCWATTFLSHVQASKNKFNLKATILKNDSMCIKEWTQPCKFVAMCIVHLETCTLTNENGFSREIFFWVKMGLRERVRVTKSKASCALILVMFSTYGFTLHKRLLGLCKWRFSLDYGRRQLRSLCFHHDEVESFVWDSCDIWANLKK